MHIFLEEAISIVNKMEVKSFHILKLEETVNRLN